MNEPHGRIKICVSGSSDTMHCGMGALDKAERIGKEIAAHGAILVANARKGFSAWVAMGVKESGGFAVGFSPAHSFEEHTDLYRLPSEHFDMIVYTGFGKTGASLFVTRSADALIVGCGHMGSVSEFAMAFEENKPVGILEGEWATDETVRNLVLAEGKKRNNIVFDSDPKTLVQKVLALVEEERSGVL